MVGIESPAFRNSLFLRIHQVLSTSAANEPGLPGMFVTGGFRRRDAALPMASGNRTGQSVRLLRRLQAPDRSYTTNAAGLSMSPLDLSAAVSRSRPFQCFTVPQVISEELEETLLAWFESEAPWRLTV